MLPPKKRRRQYDIPGTARFMTFSCYRRLPLFQNDRIKERFVERLTRTAIERDMRFLAWVIMPDHVHVVILSESTPVGEWLSALKRPFSIEVLARWRELNAPILPKCRDRAGDVHFWQAGGGYDRTVVGEELLEKVRYCHSNPVTRGLATTTVEWRWSSARRYARSAEAIGPEIAFDLLPDGSGPLT